jgi:hypothetical protein
VKSRCFSGISFRDLWSLILQSRREGEVLISSIQNDLISRHKCVRPDFYCLNNFAARPKSAGQTLLLVSSRTHGRYRLLE